MIAGTYLGSAVVLAVLTVLFVNDSLGTWGFMALLLATFFLASAGASSAYLTVSEIFPMETRALAIAVFYAIGTAIGGITGPLLFAKLIGTGDEGQVAIGFFIGAGVMAVGGIVELLFGVKAEQAELEDIAKPLTAEEAEDDKERRTTRSPHSAAGRGSGAGAARGARAGAALPAGPRSHVVLARNGRLRADHRGRVLLRGGADRARAGRARRDRPPRAGAPGRRPPLGPGPLPRGPARGRAHRPRAAARPHALRAAGA